MWCWWKYLYIFILCSWFHIFRLKCTTNGLDFLLARNFRKIAILLWSILSSRNHAWLYFNNFDSLTMWKPCRVIRLFVVSWKTVDRRRPRGFQQINILISFTPACSPQWYWDWISHRSGRSVFARTFWRLTAAVVIRPVLVVGHPLRRVGSGSHCLTDRLRYNILYYFY